MKYDMIIANPPYANGNAIISNVLEKANADEYIVLMPFSKYKANNLYKHVISLEIVDPKAFADAVITNNLCVCKLVKNEINRTFEELELETFDQNYREFYELNSKLKRTFDNEVALKDLSRIDVNTWFLMTFRCVTDGVHVTQNCLDYPFNINFDNRQPIPYDSYLRSYSARFLIFKTKHEKENLNKFWYKNPLMNSLIKGMNKTGGYVFQAIPNIDWSVDRDYEHLTYEQLLEIMKEELK